jgi:predicted dehydrogenase
MSEINLGIIGAGNIASEHLKVIQSIDGINVNGITSRTFKKAKKLSKTYSINNSFDDINTLINNCSLDGLMILVSADQIFNITKKLIPLNIPLFIEKPPGIIPEETKILANLANKYKTRNMIGFNRRFYSIFHKGIKIINDKGPLFGLSIEGHERFWKVKGRNISDRIYKNWIYANSTHTIDLLRFFGGEIKNIKSFSKSFKENLGDQFVASMEFESGSIGTYTSHWYSPGGWSVKLYGADVSVILNPLEEGKWIDSMFDEHKIESDQVDNNFKPGFYNQLISFCKMIKTGKLDWPAQSLEDSCLTMDLTQKLVNV